MRALVLTLVAMILLSIPSQSEAKPYILFVLDDQHSFVASRAFNIFRDIYGEDTEWNIKEELAEEQIDSAPIVIYLSENKDSTNKVTPYYDLYTGEQHIRYEAEVIINPNLDWTDLYFQQAFGVVLQIFKDLNEAMDEPFCAGIEQLIESYSKK